MGISTCKSCGKKFDTEERYIGEKYKNLKFCCEKCYQSYAKNSVKDPTREALIKYLDTIYDNPDYKLLGAQIKHYKEAYNLSCLALHLIIEYAIVYEHHVVQQRYGLGQFYPRYYQGALDFYREVERNKKYAEEHPDLLTPEVIRVKPKNGTQRFFTKRELGF